MLGLGLALGLVLGLMGTYAVYHLYLSRTITPEDRVERELHRAKHRVNRIFDTTAVRMDIAAEDFSADLPPDWRERLHEDHQDS